MRFVLAFLLLATAPVLARTAAAAEPVREVFLIQNSGWMEPFFLDPSTPFRPLLRAFVLAAHRPDAPVVVASFNQAGQLGTTPSPLPLFDGALTQAALDEALGRLALPRRADGAYTDADYNGALSDTIARLLDRRPGVIWMVTNNKNSRSNDQNVVANTSRFSAQLADSPFITSIVAYPLRLPSHGPSFSENGLVVYGIAYGEPAAAALRAATESPAMRQLFTAPPVRLKPLTRDPLVLRLTPGARGADVHQRNGTLVIDGVPGGRATDLVLSGSLSSAYYPQVIEQGHLAASWQGADAVQASVTPDTIAGLGPNQSLGDVRVRLHVPAIHRPPGLSGLFAGRATLSGTLRIALSDVRLTLQPAFVSKMQDLFGANADAVGRGVMRLAPGGELPPSLPAVFLGHRAVSSAATLVPVLILVSFSPWPLLLLVAALALALLLLVLLLVLSRRSRAATVQIGEEAMTVSVQPFRSVVVQTPRGIRARISGRLLGAPRVTLLG